jgi:hypothetical protein
VLPAPFIAVVDANVLFPLTLRDTVLRAAAVGFYQLRWSDTNRKDFAPLPEGIEAQSPDAFLSNLFDLDPDTFTEMLRDQAIDLQKPPVTLDQLLKRLARAAPNLVDAVTIHLGDRA